MKTKWKTQETNRSANFFFFFPNASEQLAAQTQGLLCGGRKGGREGGREGGEVTYPDPPRLSGCKVPTFQL